MKKFSIILVILMSVLTTACVAPSQPDFTQNELDAHQALILEIRNDIQLSDQRSLIGLQEDADEFLSSAEEKLDELASYGSYEEEVSQLREEINRYRNLGEVMVPSDSIVETNPVEKSDFEAIIEEIKTDISRSEQRFLIGETSEAKEFLDIAEAKIIDLEKSHPENEEIQKIRTELNLYKGAY